MRRVLSASGCACKAASSVEVLRVDFAVADLAAADLEAADLEAADLDVVAFVFGKADWDNTDVVRDHSFHCIAGPNP
ncbi:hypothetical protein SSBR45G_17360 [Bradyrhizobium sp. SSBR45G]|nr:hypothetical protein SSBR45G_17360 [Bradyrhizobium sp. SSBR45G]GLH83586.1 hypothetical protein SSBR45R_10460 [Bradyrhizobium sp. SSBR45R]